MWNASRFCVSSLRRGHANLLCIVPILVYVPPKRVRRRATQRPYIRRSERCGVHQRVAALRSTRDWTSGIAVMSVSLQTLSKKGTLQPSDTRHTRGSSPDPAAGVAERGPFALEKRLQRPAAAERDDILGPADPHIRAARECSSNGRALASHVRGTGIDTPHFQQPFYSYLSTRHKW